MGMELINHNAGKGDCIQIRYTGESRTCHNIIVDTGVLDNNSAEPALKNFAVRRRNWLFAKSVRGAAASALVYSITETVLLNHLKPYAYLTYILDELRKKEAFPKEEELKKLLPWSEDLPEYCRTKLKK